MEPATPNRPLGGLETSIHANFTRDQEPSSPTNLNQRPRKQQQRVNYTIPPPLRLGDRAPASHAASNAINGRLDAIEKTTHIRHAVVRDFGKLVDDFVSSYQQKDQRDFAHDIGNKFVHFLSASVFAETSNFVPLRLTSQKASSGDDSLPPAPAPTTYAGMAKTLKNSGADFDTAKNRKKSTMNGGASIGSTSNQTASAAPNPTREDRRILATLQRGAARIEPFVARQALVAKINGLTLGKIPSITPTRTGWAINPSDLTVRDLLMSQENKEIVMRVLSCEHMRLPEVWYNYAVPGVPTTLRSHMDGEILSTSELIVEEVIAQTKERPISCRPSRHGANPVNGKITWIVSFTKPVRAFRLFNVSDASKIIEKKSPIAIHSPGCQGYCNPLKCTRYHRCQNCGQRNDHHDGPTGPNCTHKVKCANCHGPFVAGHVNCPAAPRRLNGKVQRKTKKEIDAIRRHEQRAYAAAIAVANAQAQSQAVEPLSPAPRTAPTRKRKASHAGAAVTAHENAGIVISSSASSCSSSQGSADSGGAAIPGPSTPPSQASSQATSSEDETPRPTKPRSSRRAAASPTYNEIELSQQFDIDDEMD